MKAEAKAKTPTQAIPLYARHRGWKQLLRPIVVGSISSFWTWWFKRRLGDRVSFGSNFELIAKRPRAS